MAKSIIKTMNITRVTYYTVSIDPETKIPSLEPHPDMVFSGLYDTEKVNREMAKIIGKSKPFVITDINAGQHKYEMDISTFVLNAKIIDDEQTEDEEDPDEKTEGEEGPDDPVIMDAPAGFSEDDMDMAWGAEDDVMYDEDF